MPTTPRIAASGKPTFRQASGSIGRHSRKNPYVPSFSNTPANSTLPAVGASTCASGSQVWNGNTGTLIKKPVDSARNVITCHGYGIGLSRYQRANSGSDAGKGSPADAACAINVTKPNSVTRLPARVYKKNFTAAYRRC